MSNEDPEIQFTVDSFTVSASEKISTGEYENYNPHATLKGSIEGVDELNDETRAAIRQHLMYFHRDLQQVLRKAWEIRRVEDRTK